VKIFNLNIEGYWRLKNKKGIPTQPGVFFVYECSYNIDLATVTLIRIIYVGESTNVNRFIDTSESVELWLAFISEGHELCFSTAYLNDLMSRELVMAGYIKNLQPHFNKGFEIPFPYESYQVIASGKTSLLDTDFLVAGTL